MTVSARSGLRSLVILLVTTMWAPIAPAADGAFEERLPAGDIVSLDVTTGSGSIKVRPGTGNVAVVHGEIRVNKRFIFKPKDSSEIVQQILDNPPVLLNGSELRVGHISDRRIRDRVSISYDIMVPAGTTVEVDTGSGSITIADITAQVDAEAGSGSIRLTNIGASVKADTGSGSIIADGVAGSFKGSSGSGKIALTQNAPGDVKVSTGSGSSELRGVIGALSANAGSGSITVEGQMAGAWKLETGSGTVRVELPEDAAFDFDATASSGSIKIDHPLTVSGKISKRHVRGSVRGGGPELRIETGSGGIRVR